MCYMEEKNSKKKWYSGIEIWKDLTYHYQECNWQLDKTLLLKIPQVFVTGDRNQAGTYSGHLLSASFHGAAMRAMP